MLEPLPETAEALAEFVSLEEPYLDDHLIYLGQRAHEIVPELIGLSVAMVREGVTFTLVAPNSGIAALDALQYLDGGPCVAVVENASTSIQTDVDDLLDEGRWSVFAMASAAAGVASTLSLSVLDRADQMIGSINLYASTAGAFTGLHDALADALGASAKGVITNADMAFTSRDRAVEAPALLRASQEIETAVGFLAARYGEPVTQSRLRLDNSAERAGVSAALVARVLMLVHVHTA